MSVLANKLKVLRQQTGDNRNATLTVAGDLSRIIAQLNEVVYPLLASLPSTGSGHDVEALDYGLSGNAILTDVEASAGSGSVYFSTTAGRPTTLKESFAALQTQLVALKEEVDRLNEFTEYDDSGLIEDIGILELKLGQLAEDTFGAGYPLNDDGEAELTYTLSQALDAIGTLLTGYTSTGLTHEGSFPSLSIPTSSVTGLTTQLSELNSFVGRVDEALPDYADLGGPYHFEDKVSLREALVAMDGAIFLSAGSTYLDISRLVANPLDSEITTSVNTVTASGEDTYISTIDLTELGGSHHICFQTASPKDLKGVGPASFKVTLHVCAFTAPATGTTVEFELLGTTQVADGPRIIQNNENLSYGFKNLDHLVKVVSGTNKLFTIESQALTLDRDVTGMLSFKLKREYNAGSDDFEGTISVIGVKIDWFYFE
jgi:hypothetical protein